MDGNILTGSTYLENPGLSGQDIEFKEKNGIIQAKKYASAKHDMGKHDGLSKCSTIFLPLLLYLPQNTQIETL